MNVKLLQDQRRLAVMKLAQLNEDNPLCERYRAWIAELDARLRNSS
ncbi:hypothetical protein [Rhizobium sp. Root708]|nr:hypothetical protein [Rhizobium sp. Root708]